MQSLQDLKFQRNKILTDMQAIANKPWTAESRAKFDKMGSDAAAVDGDIIRAEQMATFETQQNSFTRSQRGPIGDGTQLTQGDPETRKKELNKAFQQYAVRGLSGMSPENRALLTTSDTTGGALIPQMFEGVLHDALKFYGPVAQKVAQKVTNNNGAPMKLSLSNDTTNGLTLLATEGTSGPVETDPGFFSKILGVDTVTGGLVKVSFQELEDSSFDLDSWLRSAFARRYARGAEKAVTLGTDSAGTALPNQATGGLLGAATLGTTTGTIAAGIGWDDLVNTYAALDPSYVVNANWVMSSQTRNNLLGLKDGFGRPYFTPDPSNGNPFSKLIGLDIVLDQSMPAIGANTTPILLGDLENSYMLRTDGQPSILRLNERFADTLEVGFYLYTRIGGTSLDAGTHPLVSLKIAAS